jgi:flagellum-specific peptidoglycan hydrolase FlgJ
VQSRGPRPKPSRFPDDIVRLAQESFKKWGVPVSITLAQWAIESGWGKATPTGSNNTFGIKAEKGYPSVVVRTTENVNGKLVERRLAFRVFNSIPEAFEEHGRLLATGAPYAEARKYTNDPDKFAEALTDKYATVRHYGKILRDFMKANNVYRYDGSAK